MLSMNNTPNPEESSQDAPTVEKQDVIESTTTVAEEPVAVEPTPAADNAPVAATPAAPIADPGIINDYAKSLRAITLKTLLGATIAVAVTTVIIILIGVWSDAAWRAIWTMVVAVIHLLIVLGLTSSTLHARDDRSLRSSNAVLNTSLVVAVVSFFATTASIWGALPGGGLWRWYMCFVVVIFAALHIKAFYDMDEVPSVRTLTRWYYGVIAFTAVLIMAWMLIDSFGDLLGGFFVRLVAATIVVNVTIGIVIAVMRRMYYQQHPEVRGLQSKRSSSSTVAIIILLVCLFFYGAPLLLGMLLRNVSGY